MILLSDRATIRVVGPDSMRFLQGSISNDMRLLKPDAWLYGMFLTPTGRVVYDVFVAQDGEASFALDHPAEFSDEIIGYFLRSRFRSKVEFFKDDRRIVVSDERGWEDPRNPSLFKRALVRDVQGGVSTNTEEYHSLRISLCVPDFAMDMIQNSSMPLDYRIDKLNGISLSKGCYCGQEAISKAHNIVGRLRDIRIITSDSGVIPEKGAHITHQGVNIGKTCGSIGNTGLGVFNLSKIEGVDYGYVGCVQLRIS